MQILNKVRKNRMNKESADLVSIIIPVYNVENYIDECLESVVNQTYRNLEIILINDGSTDESAQKCLEWADRDNRILFLSKNNEGLGPTRNYGVKKATGEWIVFLDSDDWLDLSFVSTLYQAAIDNNADLVDCNYCQKYVQTGEEKVTNDFSALGCRLPDSLLYTYNMMGCWRRLIKRSILTEYGIEQPNCKSQDGAVGLLISVLAKKRIVIDEALYFYRKGRPGAITTGNNANRKETVIAIQHLADGFVRNNLYEKHEIILKKNMATLFSRNLIAAWIGESEKYTEIKAVYEDCMNKNFPAGKKVSIAHIGSWNLMSAIRLLPYIQDINLSFQFSSLISIMNPSNFTLEKKHKNKMRQRMINRDIFSEVWDVFQKEKLDFLVMDLLEERHDILRINDSYVTKSDALDGCEWDMFGVEIISQESETWLNLWKKSCDEFFVRISDYLSFEHIIVLKNYLVKEYGDIRQKFIYDEQDWIERKNNVLYECYSYIENKYPLIRFVDVTKDELYYTDIKYEYGSKPWYLNTLINEKIADEIGRIIK